MRSRTLRGAAPTARDLADLVEKGVLRVTGQLKSARYHVAVPEWQ